jgi:glycosyltransferase involved in cell wall biosynthesis
VGDHRGYERYFDRLREMVRDLRLEEVVFTGQVDQDDLVAFYSLADLFLCLSDHEGFCVPLVEAMHFGVPVVAFDAGAVRETLGGGGVLLRSKEPALVAELVERVLRDDALRAAVLSAQARAIEKFRRTDFGALLLDRLAPVLGEAPRAFAAGARS